MSESFYDVLGVDPSATTEEITDAYRDRIKETHPDVSDAEDAQEQAQRVIEAKEVLTDEAERARYDRLGHDAYVTRSNVDADWTATTDRTGTPEADRPREEPSPGSGAESVYEGTWASNTSTPGGEAAESGPRDDGQAAASGVSDRASQSRTGPNADSDSEGTGRGSTGSNTSRNVGDAVGWAAGVEGRHAVRNSQQRQGIHRSRLFPTQQSLVLLISTFIIYPALVFSSFYPGFSLVVNVIVGVCMLIVIAYLMSIPEVGVYVFGAWTVLATLATIAYSPPMLISLIMLGTTWVPLGFTLSTYWVLNW